MSDPRDTFAVWNVEGHWQTAQASVFTLFSDEAEGNNVEFLEAWPRAGSTRGMSAHPRESAYKPSRTEERLWPTPAASLPNDGEEPAQWLRRFIKNATKKQGATRAGVPLAVAARAPVVLLIAKVNLIPEALKVLEQHRQDPNPELASTEMLNPRWVEHLMGFPAGWTEV